MPNQKGLPAGRQGFVHILLLILLLAGIILGVYLVQQKTNLLPKASFSLFPPDLPEKQPTTIFELSPSFQRLPDPASLLEKSAAQANVVQPVKIKLSYEVGDIIPVALLVRSDIDETNLFVAKLKFDQELLDLVSIKLPEIPADSTAPFAKLSFVTNWVEQTSNENEGTISLVGGVPAPGYKTAVSDSPGLMTLLLFKAKKEGSATISFTDESQILRNSDNQNILLGKMDTVVKINKTGEECIQIVTSAKNPQTGLCQEFPSPCDVPAGWEQVEQCKPPIACAPPPPPPPGCDYIFGDPGGRDPNRCPVYKLVCPNKKGDGNSDGDINLVDMSVLLTDFNKEKGFREPIDMNGDGKINTFDYSLHRKLLVELGVIKG